MRRITTLGTALLLLLSQAAAQDDEAKFNQQQAGLLNAFAKRAFGKGFPRQAKLIWLQTLKLYDPDDPAAHAALGHLRSGETWMPDPKFEYPSADTGTSRDAAALFKAYEKLKKDLAKGHSSQAQKWEKAGRTDRSLHHFEMVLRWVKTDAKAQAALSHTEVGAVSGTDRERTIYDRSKMIEKAVTDQAAADYPVEKVEDSPQPYLDRAKIPYITVRSEHFTLRGDPEEEQHLREAAVWGERTLHVVQAAFPAESYPRDLSQVHFDAAYFVSKDSYKQVLRANSSLVQNLDWLLEHASTCAIGGPEGNLSLGATANAKVLNDAVVRGVAQGYSGFQLPAFSEGIGHAFVGMMFNNNRLFSVDLQKQQRTTATEEDRQYTSPDFDVWKDLNLEMAWKNTGGVPALELPFCDTATFTNQQRIKAWSFCDYVMRRDPALLRDMDRLGVELRAKRGTRPEQYAERFDGEHEVSVAQLDQEWEDFWTGASPVMQAIQNDTPPVAAVSKSVEKWLTAFNEVRQGLRRIPVNWSAHLSTRCREHAIYLKDNRKERGPEREHRQDAALGGTHLGSMFAEMAVVSTKARIGKAEDLFESWIDIPGYRDALLNNYIGTVGLYTEGSVLVMNTVSALGAPADKKDHGFLCWPLDAATGIPTEVEVDELGPELRDLLERNGRGDAKVVGYPLTLHFGIRVQGNRPSFACAVTDARGEKIEGAMLLDGGSVRRTSAPGMVTFYPFEPLPRGEITAIWTWEREDGPQRLKVKFTTR